MLWLFYMKGFSQDAFAPEPWSLYNIRKYSRTKRMLLKSLVKLDGYIIVGCLPGRDELKLFLISRQFGFVQLTDGTGFLLFCKYFPSSYSVLSFSVNLMTFLTAPQFVSRQPYCFDAYRYCLLFPLCFLYKVCMHFWK